MASVRPGVTRPQVGFSLGGGAGSNAFTLPLVGLVGIHSLPSSPPSAVPLTFWGVGREAFPDPQMQLALLRGAHRTSASSPFVCSFIHLFIHPSNKYLASACEVPDTFECSGHVRK